MSLQSPSMLIGLSAPALLKTKIAPTRLVINDAQVNLTTNLTHLSKAKSWTHKVALNYIDKIINAEDISLQLTDINLIEFRNSNISIINSATNQPLSFYELNGEISRTNKTVTAILNSKIT